MSKVLPFPQRPDAGSQPEPLSDAALMAACAAGDEVALRQVYRRYQDGVHRFVSRLLGPQSPSVDDVVHETFLAAWNQADRFRAEGRLSSWLFGIAARKAKGLMRKEGRRARLFALFEASDPSEPIESCEAQVASRQLVRALEDEIPQLSPKLRVAFVLCDVEGLSGTEAAEALGIRPGTLWRRLHEARKQLRTHLQEVLR